MGESVTEVREGGPVADPRRARALTRPPRLQEGDRVRLVAPCSPVPDQQLDAAVEALRVCAGAAARGAAARERDWRCMRGQFGRPVRKRKRTYSHWR